MATKKREIYARAAVQLRTHDRAVQAETLCPGAMGLYLWMLLQARGEESDGDVLESSALAAWGAPRSFRISQIKVLCQVGLVAREGDRLIIVRYADHNDDRETITTNRNASAEKKRKQRHQTIANDHTVSPRDTIGTASVVPISSSISTSISGSDLESKSREPDPARETGPDAPPDWWTPACETVAANVAPVSDRGARWLEYRGAMARKQWAPNREHAVSWLSQVIRSERSRQPKSRVDTRQPLIGEEPKWLADAKAGRTGTGEF